MIVSQQTTLIHPCRSIESSSNYSVFQAILFIEKSPRYIAHSSPLLPEYSFSHSCVDPTFHHAIILFTIPGYNMQMFPSCGNLNIKQLPHVICCLLLGFASLHSSLTLNKWTAHCDHSTIWSMRGHTSYLSAHYNTHSKTQLL